jgi:hypothetical protein
VTLLRRRPREVYRVYSEEEYLNDAGPDLAPLGEELPPASVQPVSQGAGAHRRRHRVAGMAMLAGAVGIVGGVVVMNGLRTQRADSSGQRSPLASARPRAVASSVLAGSDTGPSRPLAASSSELQRSRVARVGRDRDPSATHPKPQANLHAELRGRWRDGGSRHARPGMSPPAGAGVRGGADRVVVVGDSPGSRSGPSTIAGAPAEGSGRTSSTVTSADVVSSARAAPEHPGPGSSAEFGFEH